VRRRLAFVSLAVTTLVVLAIIIPLASLVRNQAQNRALARGERDAQAIAGVLAVASGPLPGIDSEASGVTVDLADSVLAAFPSREGVSIIFPDGVVRGRPVDDTSNAEQARDGLRAFAVEIEEGAEVLVPVLAADGPAQEFTVVVRALVTTDELREGVALAWSLLGGLAVFLIGVAVIAGDRLARSVVRPFNQLSGAARAFGAGRFETRVEPDGPPEVEDVGHAFNFLADRLDALLRAERESVADLSHRLRTPLTALRLQAETLSDPIEAKQLLSDVDDLEATVDRVILDARRPSSEAAQEPRVADLAAAVRHRATFWKVLADEQMRPARLHTSGGRLEVGVAASDVGALIDVLLENVFAHTPAGCGYTVGAHPAEDGGATLVVEDDGPGFEDPAMIKRGHSGGGSTGLGLDIVAKTAISSGGTMTIHNRPDGGARVEVHFGPPAAR
jgi:signal transduction histidine kinase